VGAWLQVWLGEDAIDILNLDHVVCDRLSES
jgi:hypothetical protein